MSVISQAAGDEDNSVTKLDLDSLQKAGEEVAYLDGCRVITKNISITVNKSSVELLEAEHNWTFIRIDILMWPRTAEV